MKTHHRHSRWLMVELVAASLLLVWSDANGQATGAAAAFEGRPAMAGAQGGQGAQAGMPQGGLGVQGSEAAERSVHLRKPTAPSTLDEIRKARRDGQGAQPGTDMTPGKDVTPKRDPGMAKDQRSATKKAARAAKRTVSRARHGTSPIDTSAPGSGR